MLPKGATIQYSGGGLEFLLWAKLFISTGLGAALKISHFITCLYSQVKFIAQQYTFIVWQTHITLRYKNSTDIYT